MPELVDHPLYDSWWRHDPPQIGVCWVCDESTEWIHLDIAYQHIDCDQYPTEQGEVKIVRGYLQ